MSFFPTFIDIHTHRKNLQPHTLSLYNLSLEELLGPNEPETYFSVGIHPWWILKWQEIVPQQELESFWKKFSIFLQDKNCLALGEVGLDRCNQTPLSLQREVFVQQLTFAHLLKCPVVIIHCVRSYSEVISILKKSHFCGSVIFHNYNGSKQVTKELLKGNVYFSFGGKLFTPQSKAYQAFLTLPLERIFLESDDLSPENLTIEKIYSKASQLRGLEITQLQEQIKCNFKFIFEHFQF